MLYNDNTLSVELSWQLKRLISDGFLLFMRVAVVMLSGEVTHLSVQEVIWHRWSQRGSLREVERGRVLLTHL